MDEEDIIELTSADLEAAVSTNRDNAILLSNVAAYMLDMTPPLETIELEATGEVFSPISLLLLSANVDPTVAETWLTLNHLLEDYDSTVTLLDGSSLNRAQLCVRCLELDPANYDGLVCLASAMDDKERMNVSGKSYTKRELLVKGIDVDPTQIGAYLELASVLQVGECVKLVNGWEAQPLYLCQLAIYYNPTSADAYHALARFLPTAIQIGSITLLDGKTNVTWKSALLKAIELDTEFAEPYFDLGLKLQTATEEVTLPNGTKMVKQDLFLKAIQHDARDLPEVFYELARGLADGTTVQLPSGEVLSRQNLLLKALKMDPMKGKLFVELGLALPTWESTITDADGDKWTKLELLTEAVELEAKSFDTFMALAAHFPQGITLSTGAALSRRALYLRAATLETMRWEPYAALAEMMAPNESLVFEDGVSSLTREQLVQKANMLKGWPTVDDFKNPRQYLAKIVRGAVAAPADFE